MPEEDVSSFSIPKWRFTLTIVTLCLSVFFPVGDKEKKFGGWDNQQLQDYSDNPMEKQNGGPFK